MKKTLVAVVCAALLAACGSGTETSEPGRNAAVQDMNRRSAMSVRVGSYNACSPDETGSLWCWGSGASYSFGDGTYDNRPAPAKVAMPQDARVSSVGSGWSALHSCVISTGRVFCWGHNMDGQTGQTEVTAVPTPRQVPWLVGQAVSVTPMRTATCAVMDTASVVCWGASTNFLLGRSGVSGSKIAPTTIPGLSNVRKVVGGSHHACALKHDGKVECWGTNAHGQLGLGTLVDSATPQKVLNLNLPVLDVATSQSATCAVLADGSVKCWGSNMAYQLGDSPDSGLRRTTPGTSVPVGAKALAITAYTSGFCSLLEDATVRCWGQYPHVSNGRGVFNNWHTPSEVPGFTGMLSISMGGSFPVLCGSNFDGDVKCIGSSAQYLMGNGTTDTTVSFTQAQQVSPFMEAPTATTAPANTAAPQATVATVPAATTPVATTPGATSNVAGGDVTTTVPQTASTDQSAGGQSAVAPVGEASTSAGSPLVPLRTLKVKKSLSARTVARYAGLPVPKGAKVTLMARSSKKVCSVARSAVTARSEGTCRVRVTVKPGKGRSLSRTVTISVTK